MISKKIIGAQLQLAVCCNLMKLNRVLNNSNMQTEQNEQLNFDIKKKKKNSACFPEKRLFRWMSFYSSRFSTVIKNIKKWLYKLTLWLVIR